MNNNNNLEINKLYLSQNTYPEDELCILVKKCRDKAYIFSSRIWRKWRK